MNHPEDSAGEPSANGEQQVTEAKRIWSWVPTTEDREERLTHARRLVDLEVANVRYLNIDYSRWNLVPEHLGPRHIADAQEWLEPTWRYRDCDSIDFGVELETKDHRVFSVTWDPPGDQEGLGIREQPLLGSALTADADVAVWDVTTHSGWPALTGRPMNDVTMHYENWGRPGEGFWCRHISVQIGTTGVEFLLAEGQVDGSIGPSADNVAVMFHHERSTRRRAAHSVVASAMKGSALWQSGRP